MGYVVPDWKKSIDQNLFDVTVGGKTYQIPKAKYLTGEQAEKLEHPDSIDGGMYGFLDSLAPGLGKAMRKVPVVYFEVLLERWQKDSGISLGESSGSVS